MRPECYFDQFFSLRSSFSLELLSSFLERLLDWLLSLFLSSLSLERLLSLFLSSLSLERLLSLFLSSLSLERLLSLFLSSRSLERLLSLFLSSLSLERFLSLFLSSLSLERLRRCPLAGERFRLSKLLLLLTGERSLLEGDRLLL